MFCFVTPLRSPQLSDNWPRICELFERTATSVFRQTVPDFRHVVVCHERPTIRRSEQPLTRLAADAVQGKDGHDADGYRDYRGVPSVGAWRWLPGSALLVTKKLVDALLDVPIVLPPLVVGLALLILFQSPPGRWFQETFFRVSLQVPSVVLAQFTVAK